MSLARCRTQRASAASARRWAYSTVALLRAHLLQRRVAAAFALARKDIGLATELAREYNVPMPMSNVAEQNMIEGTNHGWGRRDTSASFQLQEERAKIEVRKKS